MDGVKQCDLPAHARPGPPGAYYVTYPRWLRLLMKMSEAFARWVTRLGERHATYANMDGVVVSSPFSRGRRQR